VTLPHDHFCTRLIRLTDRLSRFSKIAGEMVPHVRIEERNRTDPRRLGLRRAAIPDEARGERLVAFFSNNDVSPETLWSRLSESNLPKLWIPKRDNLYHLDVIPMLGSGKVDLKGVRELALRYTSEPRAQA
jgi:acyl-[acyl-carrier-protein]-phospholipid O-acyltransferase/long-chain-fatty-acid--[acyl-carrier-protein] ligase